jgi:hypothetical protein
VREKRFVSGWITRKSTQAPTVPRTGQFSGFNEAHSRPGLQCASGLHGLFVSVRSPTWASRSEEVNLSSGGNPVHCS